jgi:hypothetical protein
MSKQSRDVILLKENTLRDAPHHRQGLGSTICRYSPLTIFLFAAIYR